MRKVLLAVSLALGLSGCAEIQPLWDAYNAVSGTTVSPQAAYVTANAFDAAKVTATQYFVYCRPRLSTPICSADNRRAVIKYVKAGTAARNQLETYLQSGAPAPKAIFDTLKAAVDSLQSSVISGALQ